MLQEYWESAHGKLPKYLNKVSQNNFIKIDAAY